MFDMINESVGFHKICEILGCMDGSFLALGLLVSFVNNETHKQSIHSNSVNSHKEYSNHISEDTSKLNKDIFTMT